MSYAEFAARVPVSGSAYTFVYVCLGEAAAWFIGWNLTLEYMISAAAVARSWSLNLLLLVEHIGWSHPPLWLDTLHITHSWTVSPLSVVVCLGCMFILLVGVKESARFNMVITILNVSVILFIITLGSLHVDRANWTRAPTAEELAVMNAPKSTNPFPSGCSPHGGYFPCGINGVVTGAAKVFFSYIGFDSVTTLAEEVQNPNRDLPLGIIGTLLFATGLYVGAALVVTGMQPWFLLNRETPLASAFTSYNLGWATTLIAAITVTGLTANTLCSLIGQPRIFFRMAKDGLLFSSFGKVDAKTQAPRFGTIVTGVGSALIAFFMSLDALSEMISIGTLFAFSTVCAGVIILRLQAPGNTRKPVLLVTWFTVASLGLCAGLRNYEHIPIWGLVLLGVHTLVPVAFLQVMPVQSLPTTFVCPLVPAIPCLGILANVYLISSLSWESYVRMVIWTILGASIYFFYGIRYSVLNEVPDDTSRSPLLYGSLNGGSGGGIGGGGGGGGAHPSNLEHGSDARGGLLLEEE
jgi:APA family basic amino acid/polyamine antiporter